MDSNGSSYPKSQWRQTSRLTPASCGNRRQAELARKTQHVFRSIGSDLEQRVAPSIAVRGLDQQAVHVLIGIRHTRYVMLAKVAGKDTRTVVSALIKQAKKLPKELYSRKSNLPRLQSSNRVLHLDLCWGLRSIVDASDCRVTNDRGLWAGRTKPARAARILPTAAHPLGVGLSYLDQRAMPRVEGGLGA
jgi:hypothetical protein